MPEPCIVGGNIFGAIWAFILTIVNMHGIRCPIILPHYIKRIWNGMRKRPLQGISTYSEPADWYSYEFNHY